MKLAVVLGSTREGRHSGRVADWVCRHAKSIEGTEVELVDLADYDLPMFVEAVSPRYNPDRVVEGEAKKWLDKIGSFDAYVFVTPEYNHSIPAVLKNAFDYMTWELQRKPTAIVSHGSAGGARAAMHLKEILSEAQSVPIPKFVALTMRVNEVFDENGTISEEVAAQQYGPQFTLDTMLADLKWYSDALAPARAAA
jgi:NAD(P)H-dependent FMN reductase